MSHEATTEPMALKLKNEPKTHGAAILIALANDADLDLIAAARCLLLLHPQAALFHPTRVLANAWDAVSRLSWFNPIPAAQTPWNTIETVHLLGIASPRQNPLCIEALSRFQKEVHVHALHTPALPFQITKSLIHTGSLTAHFLETFPELKTRLTPEDAVLFKMAVMEKTWATLSSRTTPGDLRTVRFLDDFSIAPKALGNQITLGLREGQRGLLGDLLENMEDHEVHQSPVMLSVVRSIGNVQDLLPVMDALWSRQDPFFLVAGVILKNRSMIWARERQGAQDLSGCFKAYHPKNEGRWLTFNLHEPEPLQLKRRLLQNLKLGLSSETLASDIMLSHPKNIEASASVNQALELMLKFNLMSLMVINEGKYAGIVCRQDLDRAIQMDLPNAPIGPFVPGDIPVGSPEMPVRVIRHLMAKHNCTRIPILNENRVVGLITAREILRAWKDPLPLPRQYLPLTTSPHLPDQDSMTSLVKRIASVPLFHLWKKIGEKAKAHNLQAYLVGGVVRDLLLERNNLDMDVVIIGNAIPFAEALRDELGAHLKVFSHFHTARLTLQGTLLDKEVKIDFSSARIEHYATSGALPEVEFSGLSHDLFRRDFTMNALGLDLRPERFLKMIDFFGGYHDITERKMKILHSCSFLEDPTRLFRAIRFAHRFHFQLSTGTLRAFEVALDREVAKKLSPQRISAEVSRCFQEATPIPLLHKILDAGLLRPLHPDLSSGAVLPANIKHIPSLYRRFSILPEPIDLESIQWSALFHSLPVNEAQNLLQSCGLPAERRRLVSDSLTALHAIPGPLARLPESDNAGIYHLLHGVPIEGLMVLVLFGLEKQAIKRLVHYLQHLRHIRCQITGKDLINAGGKPGPEFARIFSEILDLKLKGNISDTKEEMAYAKQSLKNLPIQNS